MKPPRISPLDRSRLTPAPNNGELDRKLVAALRAQGADCAAVDRLETTLAKTERRVERFALAKHRRSEVARLSGEGLGAVEIARQLGLSRVYVTEMRSKLGVTRRRSR